MKTTTIYLSEAGGNGIYQFRRTFTCPRGLVRPYIAREDGKRYYAVRKGDVMIKTTLAVLNDKPSWTSGLIIDANHVATSFTTWDEILELSKLLPVELLEFLSFNACLREEA